jgi:aspartyl-tRNA(Asn)/glutamyl-tRNA(Gln) amidotransferase subunit A
MPTLTPPLGETIAGAAEDLRHKRKSSAELLEACLAQIDAWESRVHAWVVVDRDGARAQATQLDAELAAGAPRSQLHGIPVGIKDIIDVAGMPTAAGFGPWANRIAEHDAPIVARLREAGAIILGKTVTTTFAWIDPPLTCNPWDLERTPGGSSSGSAAALACGMVLGALGSQTGGSITRPASFCGVCGMKPTHGRLPDRAVVPLAPSLDHPGVMARTVGDLRVLWNVVAGTDVRDIQSSRIARPRLGRLRGLFENRAEPSMLTAFDRVLNTFSKERFPVCEVELPPGFDEVISSHRRIMAVEAAAGHESRLAAHPSDYPARIRALVEEGLGVTGVAYARSRAHQEQMKRSILECFRDVDVLACPAIIGPAPDTSTTGDPLFNSPWSYTGLPTASFPIALSAEGLPLAIQLVGPPFGERALFTVAQLCESVIAPGSQS